MRTIRFDAEAIDRYLWRMQSAKAGMDAALSTLRRLRQELLVLAIQAGSGSKLHQLVERLNRRIREAEQAYDETNRLIRALRKTRDLFEDAEREARDLAADPALDRRSSREHGGAGRAIPDMTKRTAFASPSLPDSLLVARSLVFSGLDQVFTAQLKVFQGAPQLPEFLREFQ